MQNHFQETYVRQFLQHFFTKTSIELSNEVTFDEKAKSTNTFSISHELLKVTFALINGFSFKNKIGKITKIIADILKKTDKFIPHFKRYYSKRVFL